MPDPAPHACVLIGRFQPFHRAHLALLRQALALAPRCVVVIGSAGQARTPGNPFTWAERAEMVRLALPAEDRARVAFLPVRDFYDEGRWTLAVRKGVQALLGATQDDRPRAVALVGHFKDASRSYLRGFADWPLHTAARLEGVTGTSIRNAYFAATPPSLDAGLAALTELIPPSTAAFMRSWAALPFFAELAEEWRALRADAQAWAGAPYPPVFVTVDAVVRCAGHVLLVRRARAPGRGLWAVPGGFIEMRETAYQSALRELAEETRLALPDDAMRDGLRGQAVFDHPDRSLRGRTLTHAFFFDLGERDLPAVRADDDAQAAQWTPLDRLAAMEDRFFDDHFQMLDHFLGLTRL